jgi:hypothetical protein
MAPKLNPDARGESTWLDPPLRLVAVLKVAGAELIS